MKIQKGITLIGLVITIIVIIILAGVTISMVIGDNGVLSNAQNAAITGTQAREEEQVKTAAMAAMTISSINGNIGIEKQYFDEELKKEFGTGNYRLEEETDKFVTTILGTGNSYEIDKFGNIVGKIPSEGTNEDIVTNLLPGLYKSGSNYKVMLKNWDELVNEEIVVVSENGALSTPRSGATNYSAEALTGDLVVADTVTSLSKYAFYYCINMTNIILPESVISISAYAFDQCTGLISANIPDSVVTFEKGVFEGCENLRTVELGDNIPGIPNICFYNCYKLEEIKIPKNVTYIDQQAFLNCTSLKRVDFADSKIERIWNTAFDKCTAIENIELPDTVTYLSNTTFSGCSALKTVIFGANITSVGNSTFSGCSALEKVVFNSKLERIGTSTFYGCTNLNEIIFEGTVAEWNNIIKENTWGIDAAQIVKATEVICSDGTVILNQNNFNPKEISDSWSQIMNNINSGNYKNCYSLGDYKKITLTDGRVMVMEIVAFDIDDKADNSGKAAISWVSKNILTDFKMSSSDYDSIGWPNSRVRGWLHSDFYDLLPSDVKNCIVSVNKTYYSVAEKTTMTSEDFVWIPSYREIFGNPNNSTSYETLGSDYSRYFCNKQFCIKNNLSEKASKWWLRTGYNDYGRGVYYYITSSGNSAKSTYANDSYGVVIGFCTSAGANGNTLNSGGSTNQGGAVTLPVLGTTAENCTWEQIVEIGKQGKADEYFDIGDTKTINIEGYGSIIMEIVAFNSDTKAGTTEKAPITWISQSTITTQKMNSTATNVGGWKESFMREWLHNNFYYSLPTDVKNSIIKVKKTYYDYDTKGTKTCEDKVWIPSYRELYASTSSSYETSGTNYDAFFDEKGREKTNLKGSTSSWWIRTAYNNNNQYFWVVGVTGAANGASSANYAYGVVLGFCT